MAVAGSLQMSHDSGLCKNQGCNKQFKSALGRIKLPLQSRTLCCRVAYGQEDRWGIRLSDSLYRPVNTLPHSNNSFRCRSFLVPSQSFELPGMKTASMTLMRSYNVLQSNPLILKLAPAIGVVIFALWGLEPLMHKTRNMLLHKNDNSWKKSGTYYVMASYIQPLLLWTGTTLICRALDPVVLPTEASQVVKQRLLNFVRSLSTVLAFAYCLSSVIQQAQKLSMDSKEPSDTRHVGFQFAGKVVYSAVWVAAFALFMELLGFSTQKWLTAGGLGTVLLTLAGREIFTNFLSSAMIHATRPFVVREWIQTKIGGYEVSGTVEHVGWWSPTIIRGEDREAVHIPNHKFTMSVIRNLSQKTHWRVKTHLAISHLDVNKINNIVADMRKVLAKNPQVEHKRLHRRVFLDNVNSESQALLIMVSCFVKTSHHEEYLCVKEAILLDLLRVISHHGARLATPIRTVQKLYSDADFENVPFADSIYNAGDSVASKRPFLLIEPSYRISGDDKAKPQTRLGRVTGEQNAKPTSHSMRDANVGTNPRPDFKTKETTKLDTKADAKICETPNLGTKENTKATTSISDPRASDEMEVESSPNSVSGKNSNAKSSASYPSATDSVPSNMTQNKNVSKYKQPRSAGPGNARQDSEYDGPSVSSLEDATAKAGKVQDHYQLKREAERKSDMQPSMSKTAMEENIVLGVALEGSKRTLPIEEGVSSDPSPAEVKEMTTACQNATGSSTADKDRKGGQSPSPSSTSGEP
uniref:Uncharacterized protein n=2 Tax=Rhizophora mucronata TaxID=61149 RepID=A0A2P2MNF9_RHIMU